MTTLETLHFGSEVSEPETGEFTLPADSIFQPRYVDLFEEKRRRYEQQQQLECQATALDLGPVALSQVIELSNS